MGSLSDRSRSLTLSFPAHPACCRQTRHRSLRDSIHSKPPTQRFFRGSLQSSRQGANSSLFRWGPTDIIKPFSANPPLPACRENTFGPLKPLPMSFSSLIP